MEKGIQTKEKKNRSKMAKLNSASAREYQNNFNSEFVKLFNFNFKTHMCHASYRIQNTYVYTHE